jgi:general secretion pathway protein A
MYHQFYGLNAPPFELTTNPRCLFFSAGHREALSNLEYGLSTSKAITLLIGEAGTGKTTLVKAAIASERCRHVECLFFHSPTLTRPELLEEMGRQLGLGVDAARSKTKLLSQLETVLLDRRSRGQSVALVVDEAQSLSHELLEEIRLLANVETDSHKLIPLVLAGQPELATRLNDPSLRQLKQRVALRCSVEPFTLIETASYMAARINLVGGDAARLFTREAVVLIHEHSGGIPRTINVICDNALLGGMAVGCQPVGRALVLEVCQNFDLRRSTNAAGVLVPEPPVAKPVPEPPGPTLLSEPPSTRFDQSRNRYRIRSFFGSA